MLPVIAVSFLLESSTLVLARGPALFTVDIVDLTRGALLAGKELSELFESFPYVIIGQNFGFFLLVELLELLEHFIVSQFDVNLVIVALKWIS